MIGHVVTDISLYKRFKQAMTRSPRMKVTACESEQSNFSFWLNEKNRISSYIAEINKFAEIVHAISLPTQLTVNQGNADVVPVKKTLRLRSKEVLGMGPQKSKPSRSFDFGKIVGGKQMTFKEEIQAEHPYLFGDKLDRMKEEEKENQVVVNVSKFDAGKEIMQGIHCVDSAREQLISARKAIKKIQLTKLKGPLLKLADQWRAFMNRSLQHFLNMVLAPLDELGYGRTKVRIEFNTLALQPREFTIRVLPKE